MILGPLLARWHFSVLTLAFIEGLIAALFSIRLERWWLPIQLFFFPMVVIAASFHIDSRFYLIGFFLTGMVFWNAFKRGVPLYLTGGDVIREIAGRLPECGFSFIDLGSGLGGVVSRLSEEKPMGRFVGVESAPFPYLFGKTRCIHLSNCEMKWGNYEKVDLSGYDYVYAYLSPVPMPRLYEKARREMKKGSLFISNSFSVPGLEADEVVEAGGKKLHFWKM